MSGKNVFGNRFGVVKKTISGFELTPLSGRRAGDESAGWSSPRSSGPGKRARRAAWSGVE
jgi:hypothetical protein